MSPAPQLPLALRYPPDQRFDTFVAAPPGAAEQLRALAQVQGADWVYLAGPGGVGKTHLALAACAAAEAAGRSAAFLPLKSAAGRLRDALEAFDGHALVALDGLDAIAGSRDDEVALFDFHNRGCCPTCARACSNARASCCRRWTTTHAAMSCANARSAAGLRSTMRRSNGCCGAVAATWRR